MKRRYKTGDWLRIPLGGDRDALAIIARACRSRLFGYFFAVPAAHVPSHDELRALTARDAIAAMLFGGGPIERGRWQIVATSLAFDSTAWPFPGFATRGAFGDSWTHVRYDPQTLAIVERRSIDAHEAAALPDARFAGAYDAEAALRRAIAGEPPLHADSVYEVRSPLESERLRALSHGGRIQFSTPLAAADIALLASFIEVHPYVELRVHGFRHGFDARSLARFSALRRLSLDVRELQHPGALASLAHLEWLRVGAMRLELGVLDSLTHLRSLELRGTRGPLDAVLRLPALERLALENTSPLRLQDLACVQSLRSLILSHGAYDVAAVGAVRGLNDLELRALEIEELPALASLDRLERLELEGLRALKSLRPLASLRALRDLRIADMPQLNVPDFAPLQRCAGLQRVQINVGSRRKEREIHRQLQVGKTQE